MKKDPLDLENRIVWIPDSKTPNGVAQGRVLAQHRAILDRVLAQFQHSKAKDQRKTMRPGSNKFSGISNRFGRGGAI